MTGAEILAKVMADRAKSGLMLTFIIPDRDTPFTCYAKDEAQKRNWLAKAKQNGWRQA